MGEELKDESELRLKYTLFRSATRLKKQIVYLIMIQSEKEPFRLKLYCFQCFMNPLVYFKSRYLLNGESKIAAEFLKVKTWMELLSMWEKILKEFSPNTCFRLGKEVNIHMRFC